jgi:enamine deaminase RidA (YjgF/YER057c/UK114 family)
MAMLPIRRWRGPAHGRSRAVAYQDLVWTVATSDDESGDVQAQARRCLELLDESLAAAGTDKTRLVSAQVFLADMSTKAAFDAVWNPWIGSDPAHWPQRACVGAALAGRCLVEIILLAATR